MGAAIEKKRKKVTMRKLIIKKKTARGGGEEGRAKGRGVQTATSRRKEGNTLKNQEALGGGEEKLQGKVRVG